MKKERKKEKAGCPREDPGKGEKKGKERQGEGGKRKGSKNKLIVRSLSRENRAKERRRMLTFFKRPGSPPGSKRKASTWKQCLKKGPNTLKGMGMGR